MKHEYMQITVESMKKIAAVISVNNYSHFNALGFLYARLKTGRIMWLGMAGGRWASTQVSAQ